MDINQFLDIIQGFLMSIDEGLVANDVNSALKKTHECLLEIKKFKDDNHECFSGANAQQIEN